MNIGRKVSKFHRWVVGGVGGIPEDQIDFSNTLEINDMLADAVNSGWKQMGGGAGGGSFDFIGENVFYCGDIVARSGVLSLKTGEHFFRFMPRPLNFEDTISTECFRNHVFLLEAGEDCGRALVIRPSQRVDACRVAIKRAGWRDGLYTSNHHPTERRQLSSSIISSLLSRFWGFCVTKNKG